MNKKAWPGQLHHYYFRFCYLWIISILSGTSQIIFNISSLIKPSTQKKFRQISSYINQVWYISVIKEEIKIFDFLQTLSQMKSDLEFVKSLLQYKVIYCKSLRH